MLDRKDKLTDEFIHNSWMKMQGLLDDEMPVKKKRRYLFWLLLPVFVLTLLWSGYYLQSRSQPTEEIIETFNSPTTDLESGSGRQPLIGDVPQDNASIDSTNKISQSNVNQKVKGSKLFVVKNSFDDHPLEGNINKSIEGVNKTTGFNEMKQGISEAIGNPLSEMVVKESITPYLRSQIQGVSLLPIKNTFTAVAIPVTLSNKLPIDILVKQQSASWSVFVNSRIIEFNSLNLEFGISRYWLRGNRFYLFNSLGIGLDKHDDVLSFTNINAQAVTPNISFSRDLLDSYLSDNSGYGNYLFGNLGIAYQLNWRWSVLATLDYRYYYTGQSENQELLAAEDNSSSPTNEMNSLSSVSIKKNNDFMINLGAEYKLSERLALFSKLYYQLNSSYTISVNNENLEKLNLSKMKELRIGLNYSF